MFLEIQKGRGNPVLRKKSKEVKSVTKRLIKFIKEMEKAMKHEKGIGLAAPQVGENIRLILVTLDNKKIIPMANPVIISCSEDKEHDEEGCLSIPGEWGQVERYKEITVTYRDANNKECKLKLDGFNARVVQHEIDHLDGILFTDYLDAEESVLNVMRQNEIEKL